MTESAKPWRPIQGIERIESPFASIAFSYEPEHRRAVSVTMYGARSLRLCFRGVLALRFEDDCPGFDPLPHPLPTIRPGLTFPLLNIEASPWLGQWQPMHPGLAHFALLSLNDLVQLIAEPDVSAQWIEL